MKKLLNRIFKNRKKPVNYKYAATILKGMKTIGALDYLSGFYAGAAFESMKNEDITPNEYEEIKQILEIAHRERREELEKE